MNLRNIIWTSVIATSAGAGVIVAGILGSTNWILALGLIGIIAATLGSRER